MDQFLNILPGLAAVAFFIWLMLPSRALTREKQEDLIDPSDPRQIGILIGLYGGDIAHAVLARFVLARFEEIHARKATAGETGIVVGLMRGDNSVG